MSFAGTAAFLVLRSARNRLLFQLRRLRRPRYLVPAVLGAGYLALVVGGNAASLRHAPRGPLDLLEARREGVALVFLLGSLLLTWLFGKAEPRLGFSEAEIQLLFPAPLGRRTLVHYRLARLVLSGMLGALVFGALSAVALPGLLPSRVGGLATLFAALNLHAAAASLTRARLAAGPAARRWLGRALLLALVLAVAAGASGLAPALAEPARVALWPARALVRPLLAAGPGELLAALPAALAVLALHYLWALGLATGFEASAIAQAEQRTQALEHLRRGDLGALRRAPGPRRTPFRLAGTGRPEVALAWKGLIAASRSFQLRVMAIAFVGVGAVVGLIAFTQAGGPAPRLLAWSLAVAALAFTALFGPANASAGGLARDLDQLDFLRSLPLGARAVVAGEVAGAVLPLLALWALASPAVAFLAPGPLDALDRACLLAGLLLAGPPFLYLGAALQALLAALFPAWMAPREIAFGSRLLPVFAHTVGFPLASVPGLATGALVAWLGSGLGWPVAPAAALLGGLAAAATGALVTALAGAALERIDPASL